MAQAGVKVTAATLEHEFMDALGMNAVVAVAAQGNKFKQEFVAPMLVA